MHSETRAHVHRLREPHEQCALKIPNLRVIGCTDCAIPVNTENSAILGSLKFVPELLSGVKAPADNGSQVRESKRSP